MKLGIWLSTIVLISATVFCFSYKADAVIFICGEAPTGGDYVEEISQGENDDETFFVGYGTADWQGQCFTTTDAFTLTRVSIKLSKNGSPTYDNQVWIYTESGGAPASTFGDHSSVVNCSAVASTAAYHNFDFSPGVSLSGSTTYCAIQDGTTQGSVGNYVYQHSEAGSGTLYRSEDGVTFATRDSNTRLTMKLYSGGP